MRTALILILAAAVFLAGCTFSQQVGTPPAQSQPGQQPAGCSFGGKWNSDWGEMTLLQNGPNVSGTYEHDEGRIAGTVSGKTLRGQWSENAGENAYLPPSNAGDVELNLSDDCNSIEGAWRYGSEGEFAGEWSGERME
ncbi:MAG: hypothetical protein AB1529_01795 [Candidatus Micrarchaeota archaeon]